MDKIIVNNRIFKTRFGLDYKRDQFWWWLHDKTVKVSSIWDRWTEDVGFRNTFAKSGPLHFEGYSRGICHLDFELEQHGERTKLPHQFGREKR